MSLRVSAIQTQLSPPSQVPYYADFAHAQANEGKVDIFPHSTEVPTSAMWSRLSRSYKHEKMHISSTSTNNVGLTNESTSNSQIFLLENYLALF